MTDRPEFIRGGRGKQAPYISTHVRLPEPIKPLVEAIKARYLAALDQGIDPVPLLKQIESAIAQTGQDKPKLVNELSVLTQTDYQLPKSDNSSKPVNDLSQGLTQEQLANRLGRDTANVGRHRKARDLGAWSQTLDPDKLAWRFDPKLKKYFPKLPVND